MNDSRDNNCQDMKELLSAYRDAELDSGDHRRVEEHLASCSDCREELAAVESVVKSLKSLPAVALSRDFALDIESIIKRSQADEPAEPQGNKVVPFEKKSERKTGKAVWIAFAAAASVALMVAAYVGTTGGGAPPTVATNAGSGSDIVKPVDGGNKTQVAENPTAEKNAVVAEKVQQPEANQPKETVVKEAPVKVATVPKQATTTAPKVTAPRHHATATVNLEDLADNEALVAYEESDIFDTGISTDEDGLYAIKM